MILKEVRLNPGLEEYTIIEQGSIIGFVTSTDTSVINKLKPTVLFAINEEDPPITYLIKIMYDGKPVKGMYLGSVQIKPGTMYHYFVEEIV